MKPAAITLVLMIASSALAQMSPSDAVVAGRQQIEQRRYGAAIKTLQAAVPAAAELPDPNQRSQALAAIHFYSAVAFAALDDLPKTRDELHQFFKFSPGQKTVDASKYSRRFVKAFNDVARQVEPGPVVDSEAGFDRHYPGFDVSTIRPPDIPLRLWNTNAPFLLLATADEKREWAGLRDDEARRLFINRFWDRRDPTPDGENEVRQQIEARTTFADDTFGKALMRGSLTDRGKVFVLLGKPRVVRLRPFTRVEGATIPVASGQVVSGTIERWIYFQEQIPKAVPKREIEFKFITQHGYGEAIMQRDFFPMKALAAASDELVDGDAR